VEGRILLISQEILTAGIEVARMETVSSSLGETSEGGYAVKQGRIIHAHALSYFSEARCPRRIAETPSVRMGERNPPDKQIIWMSSRVTCATMSHVRGAG
jgi:hypothetical protein